MTRLSPFPFPNTNTNTNTNANTNTDAFATFITLLAYAQIFATALASNIGDTSGFSSIASNCSNVDNMVVGGSCWSPYVISVWIFGVIVYSAAVAGMKETWWFQALFTMIRFIVLFMMVGTVLADTSLSKFPGLDDDLSAPRDDEFAFYMNFAGLGQAIPILAYMLLNLDVAPSVGAAMRKDRRQGLRGVFALSGCVLTVLYILISVTVTWVFVMNGKSVPGTINLAWNSYGGDDATGGDLFVKYLVVFFPPLDVLSGFPIQATALTNNIVSLFFGVRFQLTESFSWTRLAWYSGVVLVPLIIATFVSSVPDTLDISGPFQIGFAYVAPCLFIWIARNVSVRFGLFRCGERSHARLNSLTHSRPSLLSSPSLSLPLSPSSDVYPSLWRGSRGQDAIHQLVQQHDRVRDQLCLLHRSHALPPRVGYL